MLIWWMCEMKSLNSVILAKLLHFNDSTVSILLISFGKNGADILSSKKAEVLLSCCNKFVLLFLINNLKIQCCWSQPKSTQSSTEKQFRFWNVVLFLHKHREVDIDRNFWRLSDFNNLLESRFYHCELPVLSLKLTVDYVSVCMISVEKTDWQPIISHRMR